MKQSKDPLSVSIDELIISFESEYFATYLGHGGSAVKVLVADSDSRAEIVHRISEIAHQNDSKCLSVDGDDVSLNHIEDILFAITSKLDWREIVQRFIRKSFSELGYRFKGTIPLTFSSLTTETGLQSAEVRKICMRIVQHEIHRDLRLHRDFRVALSLLCTYELNDLGISIKQDSAHRWLIGLPVPASELKRRMISKAINRSSARQILSSVATFLIKSGYSGLAICVDISRLLRWKRMTGVRHYTTSGVLDSYEIIRQFIDSGDDVFGVLFLFLTSAEFLFDGSRGLGAYEALRLRLSDDVLDSSRASPFNPLVRVNR